jgi:GNAT superfamily N-acetyltransferase
MEIRKATVEDAEILTQNRVAFVSDAVGKQVDSLLEERIRTYFNDHLGDSSLLCYLAEENGEIIVACALCIYTIIPRPVCPNGKCGLLVNVNTRKDYRRRGIATRMLKALFEEAKQMGVERIELDYTEDGYPLYQSLGFQKLEHQMALSL